MAEYPYGQLGRELKKLRSQRRETPADVCDAVEIDELRLKRFEAGQERPPEDTLEAIIQHFKIADDAAAELWLMAGYNLTGLDDEDISLDGHAGLPKTTVILFGIDARTMYTDTADIVAGPSGIVLKFGQTEGRLPGDHPNLPVANVGMSYEHAERLLKALQTAILHGKYGPKPPQLPPSAS